MVAIIDDIFMLWQHGEKKLDKFLEFLNCYHSKINFVANYSREEINLLDVSVRKRNNQLIYISNQQTRINTYMPCPVTYITLKNRYISVRHCA